MQKQIAIPINFDVGSQAQAVCDDLGLDIATVVDCFLRQIVHNKEVLLFKTVNVNFANLSPQSSLAHAVETDGIDEGMLTNLYTLPSDSLIDFSKIKGKSAKLGGWEGRIKMADDFNAPIEDFEEYM